jgi:hypothetical protein
VTGDVVDGVGVVGDVGVESFPLTFVFFFGRKLTRRLGTDGEMFVESACKISSSLSS